MILPVTQMDPSEARLLRIIHTQNEIATSDLEIEAVMQLAVDRALELTDAKAAMIESPDGPDEFVFQVTAGAAEGFRGQHVEAGSRACCKDQRVADRQLRRRVLPHLHLQFAARCAEDAALRARLSAGAWI